MPAPTTTTPPAATEAPKIAGTTTQAREARQADQREPSAETLKMMPGASDLARELGIKTGKFTPAKSKDAAATDETDDEDDDTDDDEPETPEEETTTEPSEEVEAADETEVEGSADDSTDETEETPEEEEGNLPPEAVKIRDAMQKRIDKLTARHTEATEEVEDLRAQLAEAQAGPRPERTAASPLADVLTERDLDSAIAEARQMKQWAIRNRDGGELPTGKAGETQAFDAAEVANLLANAETVLDAAPARREWLDKQSHAETIARQVAPKFFEKGTPHQQVLDKVWADTPAAVKAWRPDAKLMIIQMLVGAAVMQENQKKKPGAETNGKQPQVSVKKAPPAPGGKVAPKTTVKAVQQRRDKEQLKTIKTGGHRQLTAAVAARLGF